MNAELCLATSTAPRRGSLSQRPCSSLVKLSAGMQIQMQRRLHAVVPSLRSDLNVRAGAIWESRGLLQGGTHWGPCRIAVPGRRVGGPSRLGRLRRRLTVLGRRPGRNGMASTSTAASQRPPEFYRASSPESRIPEPALAPAPSKTPQRSQRARSETSAARNPHSGRIHPPAPRPESRNSAP